MGGQDMDIIQHIQREGASFPLPKWAKNHGRLVHILADGKVKFWPTKDNV